MLPLVFERALNHPLHHVWLTAWKLNPDAIRFYDRHGFQRQGMVILQLGSDAQEDWLMLRKLDAN